MTCPRFPHFGWEEARQAQSYETRQEPALTRPPLRVAILGAGPIGLEAAAHCLHAGHEVNVFEAATVAASVERWGFVKLFSPFGWNSTPLGCSLIRRESPRHEFPDDADLVSGREWRERYLVPLASAGDLPGVIHTETRALAISRSGWRKSESRAGKLPPFRLLLRDAKGERFEVADAILDCTGVLSRPNWLGDGGIPAAGELPARPHLHAGVDDILGTRRNHYADKTVLVVGGGTSAAAAVTDLVTLGETHQSTWVIWLTQGGKSAPLPRRAGDPLKERDRLAARANHLAARCDGNLEYHARARIDELISHGPEKGFRVASRVNGEAMEWEVDRVIAAVGYRPDPTLTAELRVDDPEGDLTTGEPGYFVLGAKSAGRSGEFLLREGHGQIHQVLAHLARPDALRAA